MKIHELYQKTEIKCKFLKKIIEKTQISLKFCVKMQILAKDHINLKNTHTHIQILSKNHDKHVNFIKRL